MKVLLSLSTPHGIRPLRKISKKGVNIKLYILRKFQLERSANENVLLKQEMAVPSQVLPFLLVYTKTNLCMPMIDYKKTFIKTSIKT